VQAILILLKIRPLASLLAVAGQLAVGYGKQGVNEILNRFSVRVSKAVGGD
jgi:hypothetical protein